MRRKSFASMGADLSRTFLISSRYHLFAEVTSFVFEVDQKLLDVQLTFHVYFQRYRKGGLKKRLDTL